MHQPKQRQQVIGHQEIEIPTFRYSRQCKASTGLNIFGKVGIFHIDWCNLFHVPSNTRDLWLTWTVYEGGKIWKQFNCLLIGRPTLLFCSYSYFLCPFILSLSVHKLITTNLSLSNRPHMFLFFDCINLALLSFNFTLYIIYVFCNAVLFVTQYILS